MGCFFGCSGNNSNNNNSNKKKRSENPNHNPEDSFNSNYNINSSIADESAVSVNEETKEVVTSTDGTASRAVDVPVEGETNSCSKGRTFTYQELVDATENFRSDYFLGEGGFGKVYKGKLLDTSEVVAIKRLDRNGAQGIREFVVEVMTLGLADHPNLVKLIGYCAESNHRLVVYEYMALGSLDTHLHDLQPNKKALDWNTRMKIAAGVAKGLEYLHDKMKPPVIYRDVKCSNILLDEGYNTKLSDFGLAKVGPVGDKTHVSTRVMGTCGYCAPEYAMTGRLTFSSDIYSFGVVLLEIITGRKAVYNTKGGREKNLVAWAKSFFQDRRKLPQMADPALQGQYPKRGLYKALSTAAMCVQDRSHKRPLIAQVVISLEFLSNEKYDPLMHSSNHRRTLSSSSIKKDSRNSKKIEMEDSQNKNDSEDQKTGKKMFST